MFRLRFREKKLLTVARHNRQEIIKAGLSRRDLLRYGLVGASGVLTFQSGLSQWASGAAYGDDILVSPPTRPFIEPLPISPILHPVPALNPVPTIQPNTAAGEGRREAHQAPLRFPSLFPFPPAVLYEGHHQAVQASVSPDLPVQTLWGMDGSVPCPTIHARYGEPILIRRFNNLPPANQNGGFGIPSISTHVHNAHNPWESDGYPCSFFERGQFYDYHHPNVLAGFSGPLGPVGDIRQTLATEWYHDHRIDFTAQNVYKGQAGFYLLFNDLDTGNETTGFRLPGVPGADFYSPIQFDVPLMLGDRVFDRQTGQLFYDLFNLDGILGDKFLVNGKIQPFFEVEPRRYRFRILNTGPSRWVQLFLTDQKTNTQVPFFQISNDGNLLPRPIVVTSAPLSPAERWDVIIDFRPWAGKTLYLENRLEQKDGRGPTGKLLPPGQGNFYMQFRVRGAVTHPDNSADPTTQRFYDLPDRNVTPVVTRRMIFDRSNGQWTINNKLMDTDCNTVRFVSTLNTPEHLIFQNNSGGWMHPIHHHLAESQILSRNGAPPGISEIARKDVIALHHDEVVKVALSFQDWLGRFVIHCHNVVHEDHAMMLRFDTALEGDTNSDP